ncbi:hypothetical protein ACFFNY_26140 [Paenibacillus hodogayensis]|uniref:Uncharacterized protein n=1 Tax=Paenibacillus hodogayensis TaxID=279208 RepID=A0ABV5W3E1_9BACL
MSYSSIVFNRIRVNEMGENCGVFIGNNIASLWGSFSKQQTGFSQQGGTASGNRTLFRNRDVFDMIAIGPSICRVRPRIRPNPQGRTVSDARNRTSSKHARKQTRGRQRSQTQTRRRLRKTGRNDKGIALTKK